MTYEDVKRIRHNPQLKDVDSKIIKKLIVEKQIPQKPTYQVYDTWFCPNCDTAYEVGIDEYNYCPNCGQAIDWSEE